MNIQKTTQLNFKGYDARPLKGFIMNTNSYGIAKEMQAIGQKEGFKIFTPIEDILGPSCKEGIGRYVENTSGVWAQDLWTVVKNKLLAFEITEKSYAIKEFFKLVFDITQKTVRENPKFIALNEKVWNLAYKISTSNDTTEQALLINTFENYRNQLKDFQHTFHIAGGNIYIVKNENKNDAFIGEKELEKYDFDEIQSMYCVDKVIPLPQMDYHLDLFIRPLDNKKVLLADDKLTLSTLKTQAEKLNNIIKNKLTFEERLKYKDSFVKLNSAIQYLEKRISLNNRPDSEEIAQILETNGYQAIKIPSRFYDLYLGETPKETMLTHWCNYINANVLKKENGDLVYITNKSDIDKMLGLTPELINELDYGFEQDFIKRLAPYVKKEHIYFIEGEKDFVAKRMLSEFQGGIHCACSEIPIEREG